MGKCSGLSTRKKDCFQIVIISFSGVQYFSQPGKDPCKFCFLFSDQFFGLCFLLFHEFKKFRSSHWDTLLSRKTRVKPYDFPHLEPGHKNQGT